MVENIRTPPMVNVTPRDTPQAGKEAARQVFPARSALDQAQAALKPGTIPPVAVLQPASLAELMEDAGFALQQHRADSRQASRGAQRPRAQGMLQQLAEQLKEYGDVKLQELMARIPQLSDEGDLLDTFRRNGLNAGEMALLLANMAADENNKDRVRRHRIEAALDEVMDDKQWALQLFTSLEFGLNSAANLAALKHLYQRATEHQTQLNQWFGEFRRLPDRQRKLCALIRALAFELSVQEAISGLQLATVVTDLKRILHFFSIEDHCARVAQLKHTPCADTIMHTLFDVIQQPWVFAAWLDQRTRKDLPKGEPRHLYAGHLNDLLRLLPEDCFDNTAQRDTLLDAFNEFLDRLDNDERIQT